MSNCPPSSDGRRLLKQHSAGQLGSTQRKPLLITRGRQWSLVPPSEMEVEEDSAATTSASPPPQHSLLQIKLIEKNHALLKDLSQLHSSRYGDIRKELEKTMNLAKSTEVSLKETTTLLDKTAEVHKGAAETLDSVLNFASNFRFPDS